jgi:hypothetical protein
MKLTLLMDEYSLSLGGARARGRARARERVGAHQPFDLGEMRNPAKLGPPPRGKCRPSPTASRAAQSIRNQALAGSESVARDGRHHCSPATKQFPIQDRGYSAAPPQGHSVSSARPPRWRGRIDRSLYRTVRRCDNAHRALDHAPLELRNVRCRCGLAREDLNKRALVQQHWDFASHVRIGIDYSKFDNSIRVRSRGEPWGDSLVMR